MPSLEHIEDALSRYRPRLIEAPRRAAVAVLLRRGSNGIDVLFIKRAEHDADPWSGHMAFPGGRVETHDPNPRHAAMRETLEEVGLPLDGARVIGRLDDLQGRGDANQLVVSAHVFDVGHGPSEALAPNYEVQEAFWFPIRELLNDERYVDYRHPSVPVEFPGIVVGQPERHVVWGLTYRFLEDFFEVAGHPIPKRWPFDPDGHLKQVEQHIED